MTRSEILETLKEVKPLLAEQYKVSKVGLFGSYAKDQQVADSDIDLLVEIEPKLENLAGVERLLESKLHHKVDVVRLHTHLRERFRQRILKDVIYV